ncbi:laccase [Panus rudis PR-1116 ss-1]|nr:laccase [Panus rudis PR-1116 ss-1]
MAFSTGFLRAVSLVLSLPLAAYAQNVIGPVADLPIVNANIAPDGFNRSTVLAGGTFPGPTIKGNKGDNFQINVIDQLTDNTMDTPTSIHWHGLFQKGSNWADGPAFVTQCPLVPGNSFLYNFNVPDQAGTFWYHSHLGLQYCDGLRGAFIVYDPQDPQASLYDVDDETTIITLADWYHIPANQIVGAPEQDSTLINGLGRFLQPDNTTTGDLAVITVQTGKRYRFRLVSVSCDPNWIFSIDGHNMTIIEVEGVNSQPLTVDSLQIYAAQRYSFVLEANQPVGNYWIRANPDHGPVGFTGGINSAILRYEGAPDEEPSATNPPVSVAPLVETDLHPLVPMPVPGPHQPGVADVVQPLVFGFDGVNFTINNFTFAPPTIPVLLQILSGAQTAQELMPTGSIIELPLNSVIELNFPNPGGAVGQPHPFHLHGHNFFVVRSAGNASYNYGNPIARDTVNTGVGDPNDLVTIRFETNNPGPWFLHCHIDFHLNAGFAVVMAEGINQTAAANPVPDAWQQLCPTYDKLENITVSSAPFGGSTIASGTASGFVSGRVPSGSASRSISASGGVSTSNTRLVTSFTGSSSAPASSTNA